MPLILEAIVTTLNDDGTTNVSPMGPLVDPAMTRLTLRPFKTSRTYANLKRTKEGVLHVTDDVELMARAAVNRLDPPPMIPAQSVTGMVLANTCRWYEFQVLRLDDSQERTEIDCDILYHGRVRDFFGFNRAKHAVVEAAILATRLGILPAEEIVQEFDRLRVVVAKTAGDQEQRAFDFLDFHVRQELARSR